MAKIGILEGYTVPGQSAGALDGYRKRRKSSHRRKFHGMQSKMKACAVKWKHSGKRGKYTSFMKSCLKGRR